MTAKEDREAGTIQVVSGGSRYKRSVAPIEYRCGSCRKTRGIDDFPQGDILPTSKCGACITPGSREVAL